MFLFLYSVKDLEKGGVSQKSTQFVGGLSKSPPFPIGKGDQYICLEFCPHGLWMTSC